MVEQVNRIVQECPEVLVFLSLALGYVVGKVKIKGFGIGTTASVLLVALVLGQFNVEVPAMLKSISFALFAFCIGYQVGPQFFGALRKEGLKYLWISLVVVLVGMATTVVLGRALHFDKGQTAGLFAGAMTQSAAIGTADGAVDQLAIPADQKQALHNNIALAYAITYVFGVVGVVVLFKFLPGLLRINLKGEARKLEATMGGGAQAENEELFSWSRQVELRAYVASNPRVTGAAVREVEALFLTRIAVCRIRRAGRLCDVSPDTRIEPQDVLVLAGKTDGIVHATEFIGPETDVAAVIDIVGESLDVSVLNREVVGKTLGELGRSPGAHGLFLTRVTRQGRELPVLNETVVNKCDVLRLVGPRDAVDQAAKFLGYPQRHSPVTDLVVLGIGCVLGILVGMIVLPIGGVPLTLGTAGGVLAAGLVCGWLRSKHPTFGQIPDSAQWLLNDLGLSLFVACVGLGAGKAALQAMAASGLAIFLAGIVVALAPVVVGGLFGKYVLKMNPVLLLGALTGARVIPQALNALEEDAGSTTLVLGFAAPFAFANAFLTIMGSIIVNVM